MSDERDCETCRWWVRVPNLYIIGECERRQETEDKRTDRHDFCGEYTPGDAP